MTVQIWIFLCLLLAISIPIELTVQKIYVYIGKINNQLYKKKQPCHSSTLPFLKLFTKGLKFCKSTYLPYLLSTFDIQNILLLIFMILVLVFEIWNPFTLFQYNPNWQITLWGLYTFMDPNLFFIYPLLFITLSLLINSFYIGQLCCIVSLFLALSMFNSNPYFLLANSFFFVFIFISYINKFQEGLSHSHLDIKTSFSSR